MESVLAAPAPVAHPFPLTLWSRVLRTREADTARLALEDLCTLYWRPVVGYVRALGCPPQEAEDVTQEFFASFLRQQGFQHAEPERGKLRGYLKGAIRHHVLHWRRHAGAARRGGGVVPVSLDSDYPDPAAAVNYDAQWALVVLERALQALQEAYLRRGKRALYAALKPTLMDQEVSDAADLAESLGLSRGTLAVEQHRARRRLAELLRQEVLQTLAEPSEAEIEMELLHLLHALTQAEVRP